MIVLCYAKASLRPKQSVPDNFDNRKSYTGKVVFSCNKRPIELRSLDFRLARNLPDIYAITNLFPMKRYLWEIL